MCLLVRQFGTVLSCLEMSRRSLAMSENEPHVELHSYVSVMMALGLDCSSHLKVMEEV